ncbi:MAG TPA: Ig-like domain-containing protein, partial [Terriglobales bacterium]|nr:Ig-like domain-containing protein [Terriglobales bacterium]
SYYGTVFHSTTSGTCDGTTLTSTCTPAAVNGMSWNSGLNYYPFTFTQTFTTPGTYTYFCEEHLGQMQGTIVVLPPAKPLGHQAGPERLRITPTNPTLTHGTTKNFQAFGGFVTGSGQPGGEKDMTASATWSSNNQNVVNINAATGAAQIGVAGTATITATVGHVSASTTVTVQ